MVITFGPSGPWPLGPWPFLPSSLSSNLRLYRLSPWPDIVAAGGVSKAVFMKKPWPRQELPFIDKHWTLTPIVNRCLPDYVWQFGITVLWKRHLPHPGACEFQQTLIVSDPPSKVLIALLIPSVCFLCGVRTHSLIWAVVVLRSPS